jgi:hypothetical protein
VTLSEALLADLLVDGVLGIEYRNHQFEFVTVDSWTTHGQGVRAGRRCQRCKQWAMGEHPGGTADEVCPLADYRFVSEWRPSFSASREVPSDG